MAKVKAVRGEESLREKIARARSQPGIEAVMRVYGTWKRADRAVEAYRQAIEPSPLIGASNSCWPSPW